MCVCARVVISTAVVRLLPFANIDREKIVGVSDTKTGARGAGGIEFLIDDPVM